LTNVLLGVIFAFMNVKEAVRDKYAQAAVRAREGRSSCCDTVSSNLYAPEELREIPDAAFRASLGCGNPTFLTQLREGETVLDLGSGGGIDVLLSAKRVGPSGKVYGLDMTDEMLALARENQRAAGVENVEFLRGEIEEVPLPDGSVDVVISNCVINLSLDKGRVLREAYRVLRNGGRFAVSDIVVRREVPQEIRNDIDLWTGCIAGALHIDEYSRLLAEAGFAEIEIEPTRVHDIADGAVVSAFIRATKRE